MPSKYLSNHKLYFICSGTCTNDVIKSINSIKNNIPKTEPKSSEKKSFISSFSSFFTSSSSKEPNIKMEEFSKLDDLGIHEMYMCQKNKEVNQLLTKAPLFTSLDYSCIEAGSILAHSIHKSHIYPIPYISENTDIKDVKTFQKMKEKFGLHHTNNTSLNLKDYTKLNNYWSKRKNINNEYFNVRKLNTILNWQYTIDVEKYGLNTYSYSKFKDFLKNHCYEATRISQIHKLRNINIFLSNSRLIIDNLKEVKDSNFKYKKDIDIVERGSVWEIDIDIEFVHDGTMITKKIIKYNKFKKIFPLEYRCDPLTFKNDHYEYTYRGNKYTLFNSLNDIPLKYIKTLYFSRYSNNTKSSIKKRLNKDINSTNRKNVSNQNNNKAHVKTFENL
jgi:hypothetical protein